MNKFSNYSETIIPEQLFEIPEENILMDFVFEDEPYYVLGDFPNDVDMTYFAKGDVDEEGNIMLKGIDDDKYEKVVNYYEKIISEMEDSEENDFYE
jgi:hypothetical protein